MAEDIDDLFNLGWPITDIHFAIRGDGKRGSGKVNDPFDGSDPYVLEDILNKIHFDNRENVRFMFDKGEYTFFYPYNQPGGIKPLFSWNTLLNGWEFHGAGIGKTMFRCVVDPNNPTLMPIGTSPHIFAQKLYEMHDRLVFKGFTGYGFASISNRTQNFNLGLISLNVNDLLIEDVEVYGMGGNRFESFPIIAYVNPATTSEVKCNHIFRRIYGHHCYHGGQGVCIMTTGWNSNLSPNIYSNEKQFHLIEDSRFEGIYLGHVNCRNSYIKNCYIDSKAQDPEYGSVTTGFCGLNTDTGDNRNLVIDGCTFVNARDQFRNSGCIHMGKPSVGSGVTINGVVITNCKFHVKPSGHVYSAIHFRRGVSNWTISNNILQIDPADTRPAAGLYLDPQSNDVPNGLLLEDTGELFGNRVENLGSNSYPHRWMGDLKKLWTTEYSSSGTWPNVINVARPLTIFSSAPGAPAAWIERLSNGIIAIINRYGVGRWDIGYKDNADNYTTLLSMNNDILWTLFAPFSVSLIRNTALTSSTISGVSHHAAFGSSSGDGRMALCAAGAGRNARFSLFYDPYGTPVSQYIEFNGSILYIGSYSNGLSINLSGVVSIQNAAGYFSANATGGFRIGSTKVVGARDTGWTAPTGTGAKTGFAAAAAGTASVAYDQSELQSALNRIAALEAHNKAMYDALAAHGLIGA